MAITVLSPTVASIIGSSQALTDPAALVKELVENSLDARATSVGIEISSDTVNTIQVRDNGHGIGPDDRSLIVKRHCTSKISDLSDVQVVGGSTLGFRGEALASAALLSGCFTITTRIEGEMVARTLSFDQHGKLLSEASASSAIGTTVKIKDFLVSNPVRKKVAAMNCERCLKVIRRMLQAFALARPQIRFSMRVLKCARAQQDWVYAPKTGAANVLDAVRKVVGDACASQCMSESLQSGGYTLSAVLPRKDAVASKISGIDCFISVDSRPVSSNRGTFKKITKLFSDSINASGLANLRGLREPFFLLALECPKGSYDVNIEPSKDDVLFENPEIVLKAASQLFRTSYGVSGVKNPDDSMLSDDGCDIEAPVQCHPVFGNAMAIPIANSPDMRDASYDAFQSTPNGPRQVGSISVNSRPSNPWTIAKAAASQKTLPHSSLVTSRPHCQQTDNGNVIESESSTNGMQSIGLLTPRNSSPTPDESPGNDNRVYGHRLIASYMRPFVPHDPRRPEPDVGNWRRDRADPGLATTYGPVVGLGPQGSISDRSPSTSFPGLHHKPSVLSPAPRAAHDRSWTGRLNESDRPRSTRESIATFPSSANHRINRDQDPSNNTSSQSRPIHGMLRYMRAKPTTALRDIFHRIEAPACLPAERTFPPLGATVNQEHPGLNFDTEVSDQSLRSLELGGRNKILRPVSKACNEPDQDTIDYIAATGALDEPGLQSLSEQPTKAMHNMTFARITLTVDGLLQAYAHIEPATIRALSELAEVAVNVFADSMITSKLVSLSSKLQLPQSQGDVSNPHDALNVIRGIISSL